VLCRWLLARSPWTNPKRAKAYLPLGLADSLALDAAETFFWFLLTSFCFLDLSLLFGDLSPIRFTHVCALRGANSICSSRARVHL
jgi:hypothetical protein